jgi:hypothetical protein
MEKLLENKLRPTMLDPSLLVRHGLWESVQSLRKVSPIIYVPEGIRNIKDSEFREFYGGYLRERDIARIEEVIRNAQETFKWFSWVEYSEKMPEQLAERFTGLRLRVEESSLPVPIRTILLDEFVFLATQSSILSRMKKTFKLLEKLDAIPLINLEKIVPQEWQKSISGLKKAVAIINWIATIGVFAIWLGPAAGVIDGSAVTGVRLLLIDPP